MVVTYLLREHGEEVLVRAEVDEAGESTNGSRQLDEVVVCHVQLLQTGPPVARGRREGGKGMSSQGEERGREGYESKLYDN